MGWSRETVGPDGTVYPTRIAAAAALGVHITTLQYHLRKYGHLRLIKGWEVPCSHGGVSYRSIAEASAAIGVAPNTLSHHLARYGHLEFAGRGNAGPRPKAKGRRIPLAVGPIRWDRRIDAAAELGVSSTTLSRWTSKKATAADREKLLCLAMQAQARREAAARRKVAA